MQKHFGNVFVSCSFTFFVIALATTVSSLVDVGIQFDKSSYNTVGRSCCLVHVQWMKDQSRTVIPYNIKCMYSSCTHLCVFRVCVCVRVGEWVWGVWVGVTLCQLAL